MRLCLITLTTLLAVAGLTSSVQASNYPLLATVTINDRTNQFGSFTVSGESNTLTSIDLIVHATHTFDSNLRMYLESPAGQTLLLANQVGGSGDNFNFTNFNDSASTLITAGAAPFNGQFRPAGSLGSFSDNLVIFTANISNFSGFHGFNPNGIWKLHVNDIVGGDIGALTGSETVLRISSTSATTPEPGTLALLGLGLLGSVVARRRRVL